jgi:hypothetical protein
MMKTILNPEVRVWIYGIFAAVAPLVVALGLVDGTIVGYVMAVVGAVLGLTNGLAAANVNRTPK